MTCNVAEGFASGPVKAYYNTTGNLVINLFKSFHLSHPERHRFWKADDRANQTARGVQVHHFQRLPRGCQGKEYMLQPSTNTEPNSSLFVSFF